MNLYEYIHIPNIDIYNILKQLKNTILYNITFTLSSSQTKTFVSHIQFSMNIFLHTITALCDSLFHPDNFSFLFTLSKVFSKEFRDVALRIIGKHLQNSDTLRSLWVILASLNFRTKISLSLSPKLGYKFSFIYFYPPTVFQYRIV